MINLRPRIAAFIQAQHKTLGDIAKVFSSKVDKMFEIYVKDFKSYHILQLIREYEHVNEFL